MLRYALNAKLRPVLQLLNTGMLHGSPLQGYLPRSCSKLLIFSVIPSKHRFDMLQIQAITVSDTSAGCFQGRVRAPHLLARVKTGFSSSSSKLLIFSVKPSKFMFDMLQIQLITVLDTSAGCFQGRGRASHLLARVKTGFYSSSSS